MFNEEIHRSFNEVPIREMVKRINNDSTFYTEFIARFSQSHYEDYHEIYSKDTRFKNIVDVLLITRNIELLNINDYEYFANIINEADCFIDSCSVCNWTMLFQEMHPYITSMCERCRVQYEREKYR